MVGVASLRNFCYYCMLLAIGYMYGTCIMCMMYVMYVQYWLLENNRAKKAFGVLEFGGTTRKKNIGNP